MSIDLHIIGLSVMMLVDALVKYPSSHHCMPFSVFIQDISGRKFSFMSES